MNLKAGESISLLVIAKMSGHSALLSEALRASHDSAAPGYRLLVHRAITYGEMRAQAPSTRFDFVAIAVDFGDTAVLEWLSMTLSELPLQLFLRRVLLINSKGLPVYSIAMNKEEILAMARDYKVDIMSADVREPRQCRFVANRMIKYMEQSLGCHSGIPQIYSCMHKSDERELDRD